MWDKVKGVAEEAVIRLIMFNVFIGIAIAFLFVPKWTTRNLVALIKDNEACLVRAQARRLSQ